MKSGTTQDHGEETTGRSEKDLQPHRAEDLRDYYITPLYLQTMAKRVRDWSTEYIKKQIALFRRTIPDYPEVFEILVDELHKRHLNQLLRHIRKSPASDLKALLEKYGEEPDYREIIMTEMEIRNGAKRLHDASSDAPGEN